MSAPPEKKQKTDVEEVKDDEAKEDAKPAEETAMAAESKEPEAPPEPEELEKDDSIPAAKDTVKEAATFNVQDTTMNVMPHSQNVLMTLSDFGFQYLLACAKANTGVKAGRYMFEVKVVEFVNPVEDGRRNSTPKQQLKIGFATDKSSLFFGDGEESACFDTADWSFAVGKKKTAFATKPLGSNLHARDSILAVVLNLDSSSPNAKTVSLFKDGVRISQPQPLPQSMHGQPLFPMINFKNMTVYVNFGKQEKILQPLPFKCRTLMDAPAKEATVVKADVPGEGGYEVMLPVSLPDEGTFDWLDMFKETSKKPYTELSDRAIIDWAVKSGLYRARQATSNDKPELGFGLPFMDDYSVRRILHTLAPTQNRNYIIMEVKGNLTEDDRKATLERFPGGFKKVARVACGEPNRDFIKRVQAVVLKDKQAQSDQVHRQKMEEAKRKKLLEKQAKERERAKKKAEKEAAKKKKLAEKEAAKAAKEKAKKEKEEKGEKVEEEPEEPEKEEEEEDEAMEEEEPEEDDVEMEEPAPKVELTAEEKALKFKPVTTPDLAPYVMSASFTKFSLPTKEEGFDTIEYPWKQSKQAEDYLKNWVLQKKITTRIEELKPSDWFTQKLGGYQKVLGSWHQKQNEYRASLTKKAADKEAKAIAKKKAEAAKAAEEAKKKLEAEMKAKKAEAAAKEGEEKKEEEKAEEKKEEEEEKKEESKEDSAEAMEVDEEEDEKAEEEAEQTFKTLDVFGVEDILDSVKGKPLFKEFQIEDWTLLSLRFELHLLIHAFKHDVNDPERVGMHLDHLNFYYNKYYKRFLNFKQYGVETAEELIKLVDDTMYITKQQVIESQLPAELETADVFIKLAEESRRYRNVRLDLGDESAKLKISVASAQGSGGGAKGSGKSWHSQAQKGFEKGGSSYASQAGYAGGSFDKGFDKGKGKDWRGKTDSKGNPSDAKGDSKGKSTWQSGQQWNKSAGDKGGYHGGKKGSDGKGWHSKSPGASKGWQQAPRQVAPPGPMGKGK